MKHYEQEQTTSLRLDGVTCDRCKHTVHDRSSDDYTEMQEFISISGEGGYASRYWGDCKGWRVDLCEKCQFELFGEFVQPQKNEVC
jgi:hypothetical protein